MPSVRPVLAVALASAAFVGILVRAAGAEAPAASARARVEPGPAQPPTGLSEPGPGDYTGPGSCSATACHGSIRPVAGSRVLQTEYSTWISRDRHSRATEVLSNPVSVRMGRILDLPTASAQAPKCLACHALDAPPAQRARNFMTEGVSCEACHGPATGWLGYHVTRNAEHAESVKRGMYDTKDLVKRTEKCLSCHLGTADKAVDHEMIAAGHPDLVFDLASYSAAMPRHWREATADDPFATVRSFSVGQLVQLRSGLQRLARRVKGPVWPEYAELDCFACHHSLTRPEDSWRQAQGYAHRARPGNPPLQASRYVVARLVLDAWDPGAASNLDGVMTRLEIAASRLRVNDGEVASLANQAGEIATAGIARALAASPTAETTQKLLRAVLAEAPSIAPRGERAAEQAAMAAETLATALAQTGGRDPSQTREIFAGVFKLFETPSSYEPAKFVEAMKRIEVALR